MQTLEALDRTTNFAIAAIARAARLAGVDLSGRLLVRLEGGDAALPARIGLTLDDNAIRRAAANHEPALVIVPDSPGALPIVVALIRERLSPDGPPKDLIEAPEELTIRCGKASITLRRDGRLVIRGTHVISASSGPQKIKGASIALN